MKKSIFRRVDRKRQRQMVQSGILPRSLRIFRAFSLLLIAAPIPYGIALALLADNKEAFETLTGWIGPWADWSVQHIPAIKNVSYHIAASGSYDSLALARHAYSVGALYVVVFLVVGSAIDCFGRFCMRFSGDFIFHYNQNLNAKRMLLKNILEDKGAINAREISRAIKIQIMVGLGALLFLGAVFFFIFVIGLEDVKRGGQFVSFRYTDWAAVSVLFLCSIFAAMNQGAVILLKDSLKIWYIYAKQSAQRKSEIMGS